MDTGRISARYAKALYEYAAENKKEKEIYERMKFISDVFFLVPELTRELDNPRITSEKKKELLLTAAGSDVPVEFVHFVDLIIERKRESYLHFMSMVYQDIYRKIKGIVTGKLTTAQSVDPLLEKQIKKLVSEKTNDSEVDFISNTNPDIIGGFVLQIGTFQLDASLHTQLKTIKNSLLHQNNVIC
jgi:F-type H+-transporting ATPase subunit delta